MFVTRKTFSDQLPLMQKAIKNCDFIAIDTELSGLHRTGSESAHFRDSADERYSKLKSSATAFAVLQLGVAAFEWNPKAKNYTVRAFNVPVFSGKCSQILGLERRFLYEESSFSFLLQNNFDFNETLKEGVPYVRYDEEAVARASIERFDASLRSIIPIDDANKGFVEPAMKKIENWLQNSTEPSINITAESSYRRRLIHQEVRIRFNSFLATNSKNNAEVVVTKLTETERAKIAETQESEVESKSCSELESMIGIRHIIEAISQSKKPVVGHNLYLDLCQIVQKFCCELPESVDEFKQLCSSTFPTIYDTKFIANNDATIQKFVANSALSELVGTLAKDDFNGGPDFASPSNFPDYSIENGEKFHEAAFDAYCTGTSFLKMLYKIANVPGNIRFNLSLLDDSESEVDRDPESVPLPVHLRRLVNRLNVMRSDNPVLNLAESSNEEMTRPNVLHISKFPKFWKTHTIVATCYPILGHTFVRWISDDSCFVSVADKTRVSEEAIEAVQRAIDEKQTEEESGLTPCRVLTYAQYMEGQKSGETDRNLKRERIDGEEEDGEILEDSGSSGSHVTKKQKKDSNCTIS